MSNEHGIGSTMRDAYNGTIRTGRVVEDLDTHWRVDWGRNHTKIRKDRVGNKPKRQGPWWEDERVYYILDSRSCVGNCALWWGKDRLGYCCSLDDAGLYTLEEALGERQTDIPVHRDIAEQCVVRHVRWDALAKARIGFREHNRDQYIKRLISDHKRSE
jgi:hypothetical protein